MKNILFYILAIWVAVQSVLAAADAHQVHQSDASYHPLAQQLLAELDTDEQLSSPPDQSSDLSTTSPQKTVTVLDCQHCCHCHGQLAKILVYSMFNANFSIAEAQFVDYSHTLLSAHPNSLFRPPRV
ncbi:hypothetical protein NO559_07590 [Dasania sp. GY-MA-18]|uniref:DUF2946 domain-containing protein n=1 Tax=Dasania phycosphaerae TaxID=2950436 RepID=A0A9J6RKY4_9GAMM|nr:MULTISPECIES: hypothetical protein [Dasania]MCR8922628.1 hypothetical protein [Dasania sp. GY-MA-18]MCZ0865058.1 hypothetical protein [Dasania phycosphaerae]MCZ0868784.1 hypothetical protein [Dasania phycosphaerae]